MLISKLNWWGNSDHSSRNGWAGFPHLLVRLEHIFTRKSFLPFDSLNCPLLALRISERKGEPLGVYFHSRWHHHRSPLLRQKWKWGNSDHQAKSHGVIPIYQAKLSGVIPIIPDIWPGNNLYQTSIAFAVQLEDFALRLLDWSNRSGEFSCQFRDHRFEGI